MKDYSILDELVPKTVELHRAIFDKGYEQGKTNILNKIKEEIKTETKKNYTNAVFNKGLYRAIEIIDEYSEVKKMTKEDCDTCKHCILEMYDEKTGNSVYRYECDDCNYEPRDMNESLAFKTLEQQPCKDCISREKALMALTGDITDCTIEEYIARLREKLNKLPPVISKEKTGRWIYDEKSNVYRCSQCNKFPWRVKSENHDEIFTDLTRTNAYKYCPNCGAIMIESLKNEDNE